MRILENFDLTNFNSYKIKAFCERAIFFEFEHDVIDYYTKNKEKNKVLLGSGHNIILSKQNYSEDFVIFNGNFNAVFCHDDIIEAEAGAEMLEISKVAYENGLSGIEIFYDIPSSLGGAIVMNAGASGEEIKDVLVKVRYLDLSDLTVKEIFKEEMGFEYRNSFFQKNTDKIVLKAWLQLKKADKQSIIEKMESVKAARWSKQPKDFPNAGSVFKRPPGYYVGAIMDELELKGFTIGGAKISEKHGGFIINFNEATGNDIINIINEVRKQVKNKFNLDLEVEQRII
jgi:UDP-N-acetylmuramate dehydrogenase